MLGQHPFWPSHDPQPMLSCTSASAMATSSAAGDGAVDEMRCLCLGDDAEDIAFRIGQAYPGGADLGEGGDVDALGSERHCAIGL